MLLGVEDSVKESIDVHVVVRVNVGVDDKVLVIMTVADDKRDVLGDVEDVGVVV